MGEGDKQDWETLCSLPELLEKNRDFDFLLADDLAVALCFFYSNFFVSSYQLYNC